MAEIIPVVISRTTNSMELDYVIYTENALVDNKPVFAVYGGLSTSPNLRDMNGKK